MSFNGSKLSGDWENDLSLHSFLVQNCSINFFVKQKFIFSIDLFYQTEVHAVTNWSSHLKITQDLKF